MISEIEKQERLKNIEDFLLVHFGDEWVDFVRAFNNGGGE